MINPLTDEQLTTPEVHIPTINGTKYIYMACTLCMDSISDCSDKFTVIELKALDKRGDIYDVQDSKILITIPIIK